MKKTKIGFGIALNKLLRHFNINLFGGYPQLFRRTTSKHKVDKIKYYDIINTEIERREENED